MVVKVGDLVTFKKSLTDMNWVDIESKKIYKVIDTYVYDYIDCPIVLNDGGFNTQLWSGYIEFIIPKEVLETPLFKAIYGDINGEEKS